MQVEIPSNVSKKFRSKRAFLTCVSRLYDKGVRAKQIEDHPGLELGLYLCHKHFVHRTWYDFSGGLEDYIRRYVAECMVEAQRRATTVGPEGKALAKLFEITEEEVSKARERLGVS
jgi:hypothetical protein